MNYLYGQAEKDKANREKKLTEIKKGQEEQKARV